MAFAPDLAQPLYPTAVSPSMAGADARLVRPEPADDPLLEQAAEGGAQDTAAQRSTAAHLTAASAEAHGVVLWGDWPEASDPLLTADS
jgi:hypothetical protein